MYTRFANQTLVGKEKFGIGFIFISQTHNYEIMRSSTVPFWVRSRKLLSLV